MNAILQFVLRTAYGNVVFFVQDCMHVICRACFSVHMLPGLVSDNRLWECLIFLNEGVGLGFAFSSADWFRCNIFFVFESLRVFYCLQS